MCSAHSPTRWIPRTRCRRVEDGGAGTIHVKLPAVSLLLGMSDGLIVPRDSLMREPTSAAAANTCYQTAPGQYDEDVFRGLDVVIAEAERAGLRVILSFVDNW